MEERPTHYPMLIVNIIIFCMMWHAKAVKLENGIWWAVKSRARNWEHRKALELASDDSSALCLSL